MPQGNRGASDQGEHEHRSDHEQDAALSLLGSRLVGIRAIFVLVAGCRRCSCPLLAVVGASYASRAMGV